MQNTLEVIDEYIEVFYEGENEDSLEDFDFTLEDVRYLMKIYGLKCIKQIQDNDSTFVYNNELNQEAIEELKQSIE